LYYSNDFNITWNYIGPDADEDGIYPWTAPGAGTYWWIANGLGAGPPSPGDPAEAGPYIITLSTSSPTDIELHKSGNDIYIDWTTGTGPFEVWRSTTVNGTGFALHDTTAGMNYLDIGALADMNDYAYVIRGQGSTINSNMGFKYIRELVNHSLAISWIGLPYKTDLATADDLMDDINLYGSGGDAVYVATTWNSTIQGYQSRTDLGASRIGINFNLEPGVGYQVKMHEALDWKIVGASQDVGTDIIVNLHNNSLAVHWIALPYNTIHLVADDVMDDINADGPGGDAIQSLTNWSPASQGYNSRVDIGALRIGINFDIVPGFMYQARMFVNVNWTISNDVLYP
jgi:hypothetical protein